MRRSFFCGLAVAVLALSVSSLNGCLQSKPTRFYVLHSMLDTRATTQSTASGQSVAIGIGPVKIPDYLDRPQMATRKGQSGLEYAEYDRWAEPLDKNLARAISGNLSVLLNTENVVSFPWPKSTQAIYQVIVEIIRLDSAGDGKVVLDARWTILSEGAEKQLLAKRSYIETPAPGAGCEPIATAMSTAVETLSREIASAIERLQSERPAS